MLQLSRDSSDFAPYLISPVTNKTAFVVAFTQRNNKPPLSQIFNYTVGSIPKPILPQPMNGTVPTEIVHDRVLDRVWFLAGENLSYYDSKLNTTVTEHTFTGDSPFYMAIDHNERIWLTFPYSNRVAGYDPFSKQFSFYTAPSPEAGPEGIAIGPDNSVWFAEPNGTKIGHIACLQLSCNVS